jgi:hypothetical protein
MTMAAPLAVSVAPEPVWQHPPVSPRRPPVKPLAADRYEIRFTASAATRDKLKVAQDLLRHAIPSGDIAAIFDRALSELIEAHSRRKMAVGGKATIADIQLRCRAHNGYEADVFFGADRRSRAADGVAERSRNYAAAWGFSPVPERPHRQLRASERFARETTA